MMPDYNIFLIKLCFSLVADKFNPKSSLELFALGQTIENELVTKL